MKKLVVVCTVVGIFMSGAYAEEHHHDMAGMANIEMAQKTIHGTGKVKSIANDHKSVRIFHDPITELK